jgi:hypothetical protein
MKTLGWVYLVCYLLDAAFSWVATYVPVLAPVSNMVSLAVAAFSVLVFVFALVGALQPRIVFVALAGYYFVMMLFGTAVYVAYAIQEGPTALQNAALDPELMKQAFTWFEPVHLTTLTIWVALAIVGMIAYARGNQPVAASVVSDPPATL